MSNEADLLNELGLGSAVTETAAVAEQATEVAQTAPAAEVDANTGEAVTSADAAKAPRTELKIVGEVAISGGLLPASQRGAGFGGKRGSKYPFEDLDAPVKNEAGEVTEYKFFTVNLTDCEEGTPAEKLKGAINAATAQQNKVAKAENRVERYVTRQVVENGEYVGSSVYRVDDTLEAE